jgi:hypothetical protein
MKFFYLFCKHYFTPLNTFMRKGKDPYQHLWLLDLDPSQKHADHAEKKAPKEE